MAHTLRLILVATLLFATAMQASAQQKSTGNLKVFSDSVEISTGEYIIHITNLFQKVDSIKNISRVRGYIREVKSRLDETDSLQKFITESLDKYSSSLNVRNLQMLNLLIKNSQTELATENEQLHATYNTLNQLKQELAAMRNDTLIQHLIKDTAALKEFYPQLKTLRENYVRTDSLLKTGISEINTLKVKGASEEITGFLLTTNIQQQQRNALRRLFSKEEDFLWNPTANNPDLKAKIKGIYKAEEKALQFYFKDFNGELFFLFFFTVLLYFLVRANLQRIKKSDQLDRLKNYGVQFINNYPGLAVISAMLTLAPLFDLHAPAAYIEALQFFLIITLSILFFKTWSRDKFKKWLYIIVLYLLFVITNHIQDPGTTQRLIIIALNLYAILIGINFVKHVPESLPLKRFIRIITILFVTMNTMAILFNVFGRFSLSQTFGITAMYSLLNVIALAVLIQVLTEAIIVQVQAQRIKHGIKPPFKSSLIQSSFRIPFLTIAAGLWIIVFATNLNIYSGIYEVLAFIFTRNISLGTNSISLGSIMLFVLIIILAHFSQRNIGYFLGDVGEDDGVVTEQRSKLIMTRLILLISGYLLAIVVSGLPMDQITIMLGALGVGIGLGLQNIVNNFVSGIILIFDRPLRIGDTIEVGGQGGQIKEIGIRSSTLLTADGSEVIIPNGDILSQQIVNWTHSNPYKRVSLSLKIMTDRDRQFILDTINPVISQQEGLLTSKPSSIMLESVTAGEYNLQIFIWCTNVSLAEQVKSEMRYALYIAFKNLDIVTTS